MMTRLDVSAQNLRPGDVVHDALVSLRVVRTWTTSLPFHGLDLRVIHVVWEHLDIDSRVNGQYLPGQRFEVTRP